MTYNDIKEGMTLKLKAERVKDYDLSEAVVKVLRKKERDGYKVGWIIGLTRAADGNATTGYFKPSDFQKVLFYS